jgi:hypothetical protein
MNVAGIVVSSVNIYPTASVNGKEENMIIKVSIVLVTAQIHRIMLKNMACLQG